MTGATTARVARTLIQRKIRRKTKKKEKEKPDGEESNTGVRDEDQHQKS